jgi:plastocyanin
MNTHSRLVMCMAAAVALSMAALSAACGGGSSDEAAPTSPPAKTEATAPAAAGATTVRAVEGAGDPRTAWTFDPAQITVAAGGSITFVDAGKEAHTATADDGSFDAGTINPGESKTVRFGEAGTFAYHCSLHPWMTGTVVVTPAAATTNDGNGLSY